MKIGKIETESLMKRFSKQVQALKGLNIEEDEILSDICYTALVCNKNFDKDRGNFNSYLYKSIYSNFSRKIFAIKAKRSFEFQIIDNVSYTKKSHLEMADLDENDEAIMFTLDRITG